MTLKLANRKAQPSAARRVRRLKRLVAYYKAQPKLTAAVEKTLAEVSEQLKAEKGDAKAKPK